MGHLNEGSKNEVKFGLQHCVLELGIGDYR